MASLGPNIIYVGSSDALVWAQRSQNFFHRWRRLGPTFSLAGTPDTLVWAKCIQNYFHQWHRLGLVLLEIGRGCTTHMGQCHGLSMGMGGVRIFNPCLTPTHRGGSWVGLEGTWVGLQKSFNTLTLETLIFNYPTPLPSTQFANAPSSAHL
jgi:hypothetical protein